MEGDMKINLLEDEMDRISKEIDNLKARRESVVSLVEILYDMKEEGIDMEVFDRLESNQMLGIHLCLDNSFLDERVWGIADLPIVDSVKLEVAKGKKVDYVVIINTNIDTGKLVMEWSYQVGSGL